MPDIPDEESPLRRYALRLSEVEKWKADSALAWEQAAENARFWRAEIITSERLEAENARLRAQVEAVRELADSAEDDLLGICAYFSGDAERKQSAIAAVRAIGALSDEGKP
jgi:hypothetical protein